jgi:hypothetical protein
MINVADPESLDPLIGRNPENIIRICIAMKIQPSIFADKLWSPRNMFEARDSGDLESLERRNDRVVILCACNRSKPGTSRGRTEKLSTIRHKSDSENPV